MSTPFLPRGQQQLDAQLVLEVVLVEQRATEQPEVALRPMRPAGARGRPNTFCWKMAPGCGCSRTLEQFVSALGALQVVEQPAQRRVEIDHGLAGHDCEPEIDRQHKRRSGLSISAMKSSRPVITPLRWPPLDGVVESGVQAASVEPLLLVGRMPRCVWGWRNSSGIVSGP